MKVKAIWEFEANVEEFNPKFVDREGLAKDLTRRELKVLLEKRDVEADDFTYEVEELDNKGSEMENRIKEMLRKQAMEYDRCSIDLVKDILIDEWGDGGDRGYCVVNEEDVDGLEVIERIDEFGIYDNDLEAAEQAEKDGVKLIPLEENPKEYPYDCYRFLDTLENREALKRIKKEGVWTLFVLDFDGTYDNEEPDSVGVQPFVYLIPLDRQIDVEHYAREAHNDFHSEENEKLNLCIGDYFEEWLNNNGVDFKPVGSIDLTFGERQVDYLADYIPREIV